MISLQSGLEMYFYKKCENCRQQRSGFRQQSFDDASAARKSKQFHIPFWLFY